MARRMYEFICTGEDSHLFEKFTDEENRVVTCPECGEPSNRIVSAVRCELDGCSGDFPGAAISWVKKRAEKIRQERKQNS